MLASERLDFYIRPRIILGDKFLCGWCDEIRNRKKEGKDTKNIEELIKIAKTKNNRTVKWLEEKSNG